jgi:hypothetical protein
VTIGFGLFSAVLRAEERPVRILGIGNSFTVNSAKYLPQIIAADPEVSADIGVAQVGGCSLDRHVSMAEAHEADETKGCSYSFILNGKTIERNMPLKDVLVQGPWDYITIQQVSSKSFKLETFYPYAQKLIEYIRRFAPDAEIVVHETWSHNIDCPRTKDWKLPPDAMYERLHKNYAQIAAEQGLRIIPVGTAFQQAKKRPLWDYQPTDIDVKSLNHPDPLPDQSKSLHRLFYWADKKGGGKTVKIDGYHAGTSGEYLGGLVWYEFFFQRDARELDYKPKPLSEEQAVSLREVAHETVLMEQ